MTDDDKEIVSAWARTVAQLIPGGIGGAVAQAWSERNGARQQQRVREFLAQLEEGLRDALLRVEGLAQRVELLEDAGEMLERCGEAATRETDAQKRRLFSRMYLSFIEEPETTNPEERIDLVHDVEQLSYSDIRTLSLFSDGRSHRGDELCGDADWFLPLGNPPALYEWLARFSPLVHSVNKLESRGLIFPADIDHRNFVFVGDHNSSVNTWRRRSWIITSVGMKLLRAVGGHLLHR